MTLVRHEFESEKVESLGKDDLRFMLTNRAGSYLCLSSGKKSRYDGFFWHDGARMFKVIDEIKALQAPEPIRIINRFSEVERAYSNFSEWFFMPYRKDGLIYRLSSQHGMVFDFDVRESYDSRKWGSQYEVAEEDGCIVLTYTKSKDTREDSGEGKEFQMFVAVKSDGQMQKIGEWVKKTYETDAARNSSPSERFVYRAFEISGTKAAVAVGWNRENAITAVKEIHDKSQQLMSEQASEDTNLLGWHLEHPQVEMAFRCAISSLYGLSTERGVFAGLPWFFQVWNRDQSISAKSLMLQKRYSYAKKTLLDALKLRDRDGRIANIITSQPQAGSADASGWTILRISDLISMLENDGQLKLYFTKQEMQETVAKIEGVIDEITRNRAKAGLVSNGDQETWMDSKFGNDVRDGMRIEIQALQIAAYRTLFKLTGKEFYSALAESTKKAVRKNFWNGKWLNDGVNDKTIRPNIFIAYYCAPELLDRDEWNICFQYALKALWNDWGGLSTIEKESPLYTEHHTGEDSESYHRGDSWFWINNLAAICLHRHDYQRYKMEVERLLHASTQEILFHGCIGHHSELSSSSEMKAEGCFAQAWSAALFIELVHEMLVKG